MMVPIATKTIYTNTSSITFSNIPQTYKHLQLRSYWNKKDITAGDSQLAMCFNGDGYPNTNYTFHIFQGNGSTVSSVFGGASTWNFYLGNLGGSGDIINTPTTLNWAASITDIPDYTNVNKNKTIKTFHGIDYNGSGNTSLISGLRLNTSAVTSLSLIGAGTSYTFAYGTRFDLYGIVG